MPARVLALLVVALLSCAGASSAATVARLAPVEDASLPFGCDWSYDWEARCTRDDSARLPIGGDVDKEWGGALRFSLGGFTPATGVQRARLVLFHDGTCIGPQRADRRCDSRSYTLEAYSIVDPDWVHEREVAFDPTPLARAVIPDAAVAGPVVFDLTDAAVEWIADEAQEAAILLRVVGEPWSSGGPKLPSSSFAESTRRPSLEVEYAPPESP